MTEQEQIEQLKKWIKEYGFSIVVGILLAVALVTGWHYWQNYTSQRLVSASTIYDEMLLDRAQNDKSNTASQGTKLINEYPRTPYAQMAALLLARDAVTDKNYSEAIKQLTWLINHTNNKPLSNIAYLRIARIFLAQNNTKKALENLAYVNEKAFQGLKNEIMGDVYVQQKNITNAKKSYQLALQELPQDDASQRPIIEMKLDNIS